MSVVFAVHIGGASAVVACDHKESVIADIQPLQCFCHLSYNPINLADQITTRPGLTAPFQEIRSHAGTVRRRWRQVQEERSVRAGFHMPLHKPNCFSGEVDVNFLVLPSGGHKPLFLLGVVWGFFLSWNTDCSVILDEAVRRHIQRAGDAEEIVNFGVTEGIYYINVSGTEKNETDIYSLSTKVIGLWKEGQEFDPNEDLDHANELKNGQEIVGYASPNEDIDWYTITLPEPGPSIWVVELSAVP